MSTTDPDSKSAHDQPQHSWGNMSDAHWSRARADKNAEALEYYRQRSRAPGVAEGGEARNFYCMHCDGVIPHDFRGEHCPHCHAELDERIKRYFNWVEINDPPASDFRALLPIALAGLAVLALVATGLVFWWRSR
jgi:hypothetical protein